MIGQPNRDEFALHQCWLKLQAELGQLCSLRPVMDDIAAASVLIYSAGAVKWAKRLQTKAAEGGTDPLVPAAWRISVDYSGGGGFIRPRDR